MQNLVLEHYYGDYECCGTDVYCLKYESIEAFYVHLEQACLNYIKEETEYRKLFEIWDEKHKKLYFNYKKAKNVKKEKFQKEINEHYKDCPVFDEKKAIVNIGCQLDLRWFIEDGKFISPDIRTLEEWFEYKYNESQNYIF